MTGFRFSWQNFHNFERTDFNSVSLNSYFYSSLLCRVKEKKLNAVNMSDGFETSSGLDVGFVMLIYLWSINLLIHVFIYYNTKYINLSF